MQTKMSAGAKYVCLTLALFMSPMGKMQWPGKKTLAGLMGITEANVTKALKAAREAGWLKYRRGWGDEPSVYWPSEGEVQREGTVDPGPDTLTLEQERRRVERELEVLSDPTTIALVKSLGGRITNIQTDPTE
jgi:hypothetical protein